MSFESIWIAGSSRSGKTTRLIDRFCTWMERESDRNQRGFPRRRLLPAPLSSRQAPAVLVFAANGDNRRDLTDRIATATQGKYPVQTTTPLGFFQDEVILFWPLLIRRLNLRAQFPVRLRPETEQELATGLWRPELDRGIWQQSGVNEYRFVRRVLDLFLLAGASGTPIEEIESILANLTPTALREGDARENLEPSLFLSTTGEGNATADSFKWETAGELLRRWRNWCWERGLLTYGIIYELYWRYLLTDPAYQEHLTQRYQWVLADDVDDYPSVTRRLFDFLLDRGAIGAFTYNPDGGIRSGLGSDPDYMALLASRCQSETLNQRSIANLEDSLGFSLVELVNNTYLATLPESVQSIQTTSRAQLLRQTADTIASSIRQGEVRPEDVAVIAPGMDAIARYTLAEILTSKGIPTESLNDQRPLSSSPVIRALLTLLALVYPGLGRLADGDAIAEMLVVLSRESGIRGQASEENLNSSFQIDPARAGLIADYCYAPDPELPKLLPVKSFPRWDRLGYRATAVYEGIVKWLEMQRAQQEQRLIPSPVHVLDRAIQRFLWNGSNLPYEQLAALRELLETAQHYWEVDARMRKSELNDTPAHTTVGRFIQMLRRGTVTANPFPVRSFGTGGGVTLSNIFQYRSSRRFHKWQFWLDAGSPLWLSGGVASLFGSQLFLQSRFGRPWTAQEEIQADEERLRRILKDLLGRAEERVYLCHSDLAVNGQEQTGPLLPLISASIPKDYIARD